MDRAQLERAAIFEPRGVTLDRLQQLAQARAELLRRDREHADLQEESRRQFELHLQAMETQREEGRQKHQSELAQRQMEHAAALAREQLDTSQAAARAAKWAAWAAGVAALGAIGQVIVAVLR